MVEWWRNGSGEMLDRMWMRQQTIIGMPPEVLMTSHDRAYTSPIWYTPRK